VQQAEMCSSKC